MYMQFSPEQVRIAERLCPFYAVLGNDSVYYYMPTVCTTAQTVSP